MEYRDLYDENKIELEDTLTSTEFLEVIESVGFKTYLEEQVNKA